MVNKKDQKQIEILAVFFFISKEKLRQNVLSGVKLELDLLTQYSQLTCKKNVVQKNQKN